MSKPINKQSREGNSDYYERRDKALERVIAVWEKGEAAGEDEMVKALDALTLAHISVTFTWASGSIEW